MEVDGNTCDAVRGLNPSDLDSAGNERRGNFSLGLEPSTEV